MTRHGCENREAPASLIDLLNKKSLNTQIQLKLDILDVG